MNADHLKKKKKLNRHRKVAVGSSDLISASAFHLFGSPHRLFTCMQPNINTIGQKPEHCGYQNLARRTSSNER